MMRAAIIGGGFAGNMHAEAMRSCGVTPQAIITTSEESARRFAARWNIPRWGTSAHLILSEDIDSVHICTPPSTHGYYVEQALAAGKHVFCEKPLCFNTGEAERLAELSSKSGKICALTYNVRYHMAVQKAREIILSGKFGRPLLIHGSYLQEFHVLPTPYDWRYDSNLAGSMRAVTEIGSHWVDTVQYISGKKVKAVSALFGKFFPERYIENGVMMPVRDDRDAELYERIRVDSEDAACISFRYEDGAIGSCVLSEISPGRGNRLSIEITCENGNLWWNEEENNVLHTALHGEGVHSEIFAFGNGFNDTFAALMRNFYRAVRLSEKLSDGGAMENDSGKLPPGSGDASADDRYSTENLEYPTFREGAQITAVTEAILESAENDSRWVKL